MFDIAWSEMALVGVVALVVIGPKDLPRVMREIGKLTQQARTMARSFRAGFDDMMREAELDELRRKARQTVDDMTQTIHAPADPAPPPPAPPRAE